MNQEILLVLLFTIFTYSISMSIHFANLAVSCTNMKKNINAKIYTNMHIYRTRN